MCEELVPITGKFDVKLSNGGRETGIAASPFVRRPWVMLIVTVSSMGESPLFVIVNVILNGSSYLFSSVIEKY